MVNKPMNPKKSKFSVVSNRKLLRDIAEQLSDQAQEFQGFKRLVKLYCSLKDFSKTLKVNPLGSYGYIWFNNELEKASNVLDGLSGASQLQKVVSVMEDLGKQRFEFLVKRKRVLGRIKFETKNQANFYNLGTMSTSVVNIQSMDMTGLSIGSQSNQMRANKMKSMLSFSKDNKITEKLEKAFKIKLHKNDEKGPSNSKESTSFKLFDSKFYDTHNQTSMILRKNMSHETEVGSDSTLRHSSPSQIKKISQKSKDVYIVEDSHGNEFSCKKLLSTRIIKNNTSIDNSRRATPSFQGGSFSEAQGAKINMEEFHSSSNFSPAKMDKKEMFTHIAEFLGKLSNNLKSQKKIKYPNKKEMSREELPSSHETSNEAVNVILKDVSDLDSCSSPNKKPKFARLGAIIFKVTKLISKSRKRLKARKFEKTNTKVSLTKLQSNESSRQLEDDIHFESQEYDQDFEKGFKKSNALDLIISDTESPKNQNNLTFSFLEGEDTNGESDINSVGSHCPNMNRKQNQKKAYFQNLDSENTPSLDMMMQGITKLSEDSFKMDKQQDRDNSSGLRAWRTNSENLKGLIQGININNLDQEEVQNIQKIQQVDDYLEEEERLTASDSGVYFREKEGTLSHYPGFQAVETLKLSDFQLIKLLGQGAYGKVYLVRQSKTDDIYALKIIGSKKMIDSQELKHIINEKSVLKMVDGQFTVTALGTFVFKNLVCFVMEYVPGGDLFQQIFEKQEISLDSFSVKFYIAELVVALEELHTAGIIHRDIKPGNILLDIDGHLKLTDYGLSDIKAKMDKTIKGSLNYMAPENFLDEEIGYEVDWYALGVLAFFLVKERYPLEGDNKEEMIQNIFKHDVKWEIEGKIYHLIIYRRG